MNDSIFYTAIEKNHFDNLEVDLPALFRQYPLEQLAAASEPVHKDFFAKIYANQWVPLGLRINFWRAAFNGHQDLSWFENLSEYWSQILRGRPLWGPYDAYFLKNLFRIKFQGSALPDTEDANIHLQAWQRPELLYSLFHLASKPSLPADVRIMQQAMRYVGRNHGLAILEFGCATAPFVYATTRFLDSGKNTYHLADLAMLPFHYGVWRLRSRSDIVPHTLQPENQFLPDFFDPMDLVLCSQVFEHLNKPLEIAKYFHQILKPGGVLVFDFMLTEGTGLDSKQAVEQHSEVLDFIQTHFEVLQGSQLQPGKSVDLCFARKRA
ncbi:MAG: class I SAM-dependent methyltransferase [Anaerolineales bacterium]|nr:class I SAM-dependent methyltransferase [Anaerolineales bacterium]